MTRRTLDAAWPIALLVVFVATFRQPPSDTAAASPAGCDEVGRIDAAALERCVALEPRNVQLLTDLGDVYAANGTADRAELMYRRALDIDPHDGDGHVRLGELLLRRGDRAGAAAEAEAALRWQPGSGRALRLRSAAHEAVP